MRVHERVEFNRHILRDDDSPGGCAGYTAATTYDTVLTTPTDAGPSTVYGCSAAQAQVQQPQVTVYMYDEEGEGDEGDDEGDNWDTSTETDDITIWQTYTATETDTISNDDATPTDNANQGCGCGPAIITSPPVITVASPQPIVQTICPIALPPPISPSVISICPSSSNASPAPEPVLPSPAPAPDFCKCSGYDDDYYDDDVLDAAPCGGSCLDYEHPYGDDTVDWVLDTKDHTRHRLENFKDRADRAISHVRPSHIHDRISQVVHDGRPQRSENHRQLHDYNGRTPIQERRYRTRQDRRFRDAAYARGRAHAHYPYTYQRLNARYPQPVRAPARPSRHANRRYRKDACSAPVRAHRVVRADSCDCPTYMGNEFEHQYGDDTMNFLLDTKDHTRHFYNRAKDRTKKALSHFTPHHVHDRVDQFVHEERPERTEDHLVLHQTHGRY